MKEFEHGNQNISHKEMSAQSVLFFIAGYDTTNAVFDHLISFLGQHPEWQDKLYEELKDKDLEYDKLGDYPVLNAVINETLRLKASLTVIERVAKEDCEILDTGIKVTAGTTISIQPYVIHRDADNFDNPNEFMPERFIDTGLDKSIAFIPFGVGSRFCIGMRFALNELRIGVAKFFLSYRVKLAKDFDLNYYNGSPLLSPKHVKIQLFER